MQQTTGGKKSVLGEVPSLFRSVYDLPAMCNGMQVSKQVFSHVSD